MVILNLNKFNGIMVRYISGINYYIILIVNNSKNSDENRHPKNPGKMINSNAKTTTRTNTFLPEQILSKSITKWVLYMSADDKNKMDGIRFEHIKEGKKLCSYPGRSNGFRTMDSGYQH